MASLRDWKRSEIEMLGTDSDAKIAQLLGLHQKTVQRKRLEHEISARRKEITWTPEMDRAALTLPTKEVAEKYGVSERAVRSRLVRLRKILRKAK
jgi:DNA-binding CsgD family transcriptional regulator